MILEWENAGRLKHAREDLLRVVALRFSGALPRKFIERVEDNEDLNELKRWFDTAVTADDSETFTKAVNGAS